MIKIFFDQFRNKWSTAQSFSVTTTNNDFAPFKKNDCSLFIMFVNDAVVLYDVVICYLCFYKELFSTWFVWNDDAVGGDQVCTDFSNQRCLSLFLSQTWITVPIVRFKSYRANDWYVLFIVFERNDRTELILIFLCHYSTALVCWWRNNTNTSHWT